MAKKLSAIRQLSLQCETPPPTRPILKKQHSEGEPDETHVGIRVSLSAKTRPKVKVAWCDDQSEETNKTEPPKSKDNDVLHSRQDIAQKLRQAWRDREKNKKSLSIFLAQTKETDAAITTPKIDHAEVDFKALFHKHRKERAVSKSPRLPTPCNYIPSRQETRSRNFNCNTIVVVPVIERPPKPEEEPKDEAMEEEKTTASIRREMFQKRTNSAFNGTISRAPLVRSSSTPTPKTSKFLANKRKTKPKSSNKRKNQLKDGKEEALVEQRKCSDIVTMVSLVSPSESEQEEEPDVQQQLQQQPKATSPKKCAVEPGGNNKSFSLRKTVKQVSFQQSSIHAVRSFSASFPSRRASMATAMLLGSAAKKLQKGLALEKRGQQDRDEQQVGPKRRLVRSLTIATDGTAQPTNTSTNDDGNIDDDDNERQESTSEDQSANTKIKEEKEEESPKEKECWATYCRMNERGLNVSYDTILRGMLTPTEYRLRRKLSLQELPEDNC